MISPARVCAGWTAVVIAAAALGLAGCGSTVRHSPPVADLCIAVGLPTSGNDAAVGNAVLAGLEREIPAQGVDYDGYKIILCKIGYPAGASATSSLQGLLVNAAHAAIDKRTIAYIGALTGPAATDVDAVLAQAGIPLITPSGPSPTATTPIRRSGPEDSVVPARSTALYLLPSVASQAEAQQEVRASRRCTTIIHKHTVGCDVVVSSPLCSGIPAAPSASLPRLCVLAGPNLSQFAPPAVAYGYSAGILLKNTFAAVGASGGDISSRSTILRRLTREDLKQTPIGPIRFDSMGGIKANHFTVYTVEQNGGLVNPQTFNAH